MRCPPDIASKISSCLARAAGLVSVIGTTEMLARSATTQVLLSVTRAEEIAELWAWGLPSFQVPPIDHLHCPVAFVAIRGRDLRSSRSLPRTRAGAARPK